MIDLPSEIIKTHHMLNLTEEAPITLKNYVRKFNVDGGNAYFISTPTPHINLIIRNVFPRYCWVLSILPFWLQGYSRLRPALIIGHTWVLRTHTYSSLYARPIEMSCDYARLKTFTEKHPPTRYLNP